MLLCDELLMVASVLQNGDCSTCTQQLSSRRLQRIADDVRRIQEMADGIVGDAQDEAALAAPVPLQRHVRLVR